MDFLFDSFDIVFILLTFIHNYTCFCTGETFYIEYFTMDIDDPDSISLDIFFTWKVESLKCFLDKKGLHKDGTKAELAALCFAAVRMKVPVRPSNEESMIIKKREGTPTCY